MKKSKTQNLIDLIAKKSINYHDFIALAMECERAGEIDFDPKDFSMWQLLGIKIIKLDNGKITLKSREILLDEADFCFVDIETNGGIDKGQIIEIGAIKVHAKEILNTFKTFVYASDIPDNIVELTGIHTNDLKNAPHLSNVLENFRLFLGDSVFVAHNVKFDYGFISESMQKIGFGGLLNRRIDTIDLAKRTIAAQKYGLSSLKELLGIENEHHRAFSDALSCYEIFKFCAQKLPWYVQTIEDLIEFSKTAKSLTLPKTNKI